jgi:AraC-like DNA-binding protein
MENYVIGFYTLLGILLAVSQCFTISRNPIKTYLVCIYVIFSAFLAQTFLWKTGLMKSYPFLAFINYPLSLLAGPLIERYFLLMIFGQAFSLRKFIILLASIYTIGFFALEMVIGNQSKAFLVNKVLTEGYAPAGRLLVFLTFLFFSFFSLRLVYKFYSYFRIKTLLNSQPIRYLFLLLLAQGLSISVGALYVYYLHAGTVDARSIIVHAMGLFLCSTIILEQAYPGIMDDLKAEVVKERKYKNSQLGSVNIENTTTQLHRLLFSEKIYRDESLTQDKLASLLNLNRHQFSEYLSQHQGKTFFQLINSYRIKESKHLLIKEPNETILSIAFAVGFQTKSVFNSAFKKETGLTPSEYRKQQGQAITSS